MIPVSTTDAPALPGVPVLLPPPPPLDGFAAQEFALRRKTLRQSFPENVIILQGNVESPGSNVLPYRQNTTFFYFTGVDTPGAAMVLLPGGFSAATGVRGLQPDLQEFLFLPDRNATTETWTGPKLGPGAITEGLTGFQKCLSAGSLWTAVTGWLKQCPRVALMAPFGAGSNLTAEYQLLSRLRDIAPVAAFQDISAAVASQRIIKSPAELERMERAASVTMAAQHAARSVVHNGGGRNECEVEAAVMQAFYSRGAAAAFAPIVGSGERATVLHYDQNNQPMTIGSTVVVDIGALLGHYCGDITRTYAVGGQWSPRQREIAALVLASHHHVVDTFTLGQDTVETIAEKCKAFYRESPLRAAGADGTAETLDNFLPHGISHHLGMDVHDVHSAVNWTVPLQTGCIVTVEPGLYLPAEGIGIRLENDYVITDKGMRSLAEPLSRDVDELA